MPSTRTYSRSFAGGELSPEMFGRIDDAKFQAGAATLRNFIVNPTGAAMNRAGFAYVNATRNNGVARLIPFTYDVNQTMVIELGDKYARFHTQGETLEYSKAGMPAWIPPSGALTFAYATPGIVTWTAHGLATGAPIRFYAYGSSTPVVPGGMQLGYTYTVQVIDANNFTLLDQNGNAVTLTDPSGGGGSSTNYPGSGSPTVSLNLAPGQSSSINGGAVGGLANVPVTGGLATLNATISASVYAYQGGGAVSFQYSIDGVHWNNFAIANASEIRTLSVSIAIANLDTLQIRCTAGGSAGPGGSVHLSGTISAWSVDVPTSGGGPSSADVRAYAYYAAGDNVLYGGAAYLAVVDDTGGVTTPGTNAAVWYALPTDLTYEIPTPYAAADLFDIHYTQSADVMTLVHPNYPPAELRRLSAAEWALAPIVFGPPLNAPLGVAVTASPGYLAQIQTISTADPALITTKSNHTLAMGDGIYIANLTATIGGVATVMDGFYMVQSVPVDGSGNLIPNELTVMDYSGNSLDSTGWSSYHATDGTKPITIQYGTKIFDIVNPYAVQAIASDGVSTSALSASASVLNNLDVPGSFNTISWIAAAGAQSYNVYKQFNGLWGYIGNTTDTSLVDDNIAPDMSITPGTPDAVFSGVGNYPGAVCYFQQRRCFAGTTNGPDNAWMSNSGTESMFSYSLPSEDTDRIAFRVAALEADVIQHMVPMLQLVLLTSESEFALVPGGSTAITPTSISVNPQSYVGASGVQPTIINTTLVYAAARGGHVRELGYAWTVNGYMTGDLSLRAAHLFDTLTIVDQAYSKAPWPIVWFVSSSGKLLGLTYIPEEQVGAWHQHDTQGSFESICCVAEGAEDVLYAVINRTIGGETVRYVERMATRLFDTLVDAFFVDAGASQSFGTAVTEISGLTWLEGQKVAVLADGGVQSQKTVTGGAITLDHAAKVIQVGLPYTSDLETLPAVLQLDGYGQGRMKNINKAWVKVYQSSGILVGPDEDHLTEIKQRTTEPWGSPPALASAELMVMTTPSWQENGQTLIRQQNPLPLDVVGLTLEVAIGG
jgi:hypothetical protein